MFTFKRTWLVLIDKLRYAIIAETISAFRAIIGIVEDIEAYFAFNELIEVFVRFCVDKTRKGDTVL